MKKSMYLLNILHRAEKQMCVLSNSSDFNCNCQVIDICGFYMEIYVQMFANKDISYECYRFFMGRLAKARRMYST